MKFKFVVIIFNILIVLVLSAVALVPNLLFGHELAKKFLLSAWPLAGILALALAALNIFFLLNRRLFTLLEKEDWPAVVDYLERKIFRGGHYSSRHVRLLVNSYLLMSDTAGVQKLENKIAIAKPALLAKNALIFGAAHILGGDAKGAADFFQTRLEKDKATKSLWIRWYYGFSLMVAGMFEKAEEEFKALITEADEALLVGLSAYFLSGTLLKHSANQHACRVLAEAGRTRIRRGLNGIGDWRRDAAKFENEVYAAIIKKYIDEAGVWLFSNAD